MMKTWTVRKLLGMFGAVCACSAALAKLPVVPPSDEAKAAAAAAAEKGAWSSKVGAYQLCKAQDKAVAHYRSTGKDVKPATPTPACADPGPFVAAAPDPAKKP